MHLSRTKKIKRKWSFTSVSIVLLLLTVFAATSRLLAEQSLQKAEELAVQRAVSGIAPAVVKIETFGGRERVGRFLVGTGPTTGCVVSPEGYVVSSSFNFIQHPSSILVTFSNGQRAPAKIVARDHSRMLVLLKVSNVESLVTAESVPRSDMQVGQWTIAVGRTYDGQPSCSVGILSAVNRIWSKAIQTDAKVSPSNYGGPIVDIRGKVLGVLVPLSPGGRGGIAGSQWYDSGIGFAIPLADILERLGEWKNGQDLHPGIMGISLQGNDMYTLPATVAVSLPNSPARAAGIKAGDQIVEVDGVPIERQVQLKHALGPRYAGDAVRVVALRNEQRIEATVTLTDAVAPFEHPFFGVLPRRDLPDDEGIVVRYVYPDSPAQRAGIKIDDRLLNIAGSPIQDTTSAWAALAAVESRANVHVALRRGEAIHEVTTSLITLPQEIPVLDPPLPHQALPDSNGHPAVGIVNMKIPELPNECFAYVPKNYHPSMRYGLVVWLHKPGDFDQDQTVQRWKLHCEQDHIILLVPKSSDPSRWQPTEIDFVRKTIDQVASNYRIDRTRVVVHGYQAGGTLAYMLAFSHLDMVRAVAAVDAALPRLLRPPATDPLLRLSIFMTTSQDSKLTERIKSSASQLRELKYPVTLHHQSPTAGYWDQQSFDTMLRWIDALDRI